MLKETWHPNSGHDGICCKCKGNHWITFRIVDKGNNEIYDFCEPCRTFMKRLYTLVTNETWEENFGE